MLHFPETVLEEVKDLVSKDLWERDPQKALIIALRRSAKFMEDDYCERYKDVQRHKIDPIEHFVKFGINEDRTANFIFQKSEAILSVIIPTYNSEKYIKKSIFSIISQTYKKIEIIVYDDASTDNTVAIVKELMNKFDCIKLIRNDINCGQGKGRNEALKIASGKFITFLDSDDFYSDENYIEFLINKAQYDNADIIVTPYIREFDGYRTQDRTITGVFSGYEAAQLFLDRKFGTHAPGGKLFTASIARKAFFSEYGYSQDVLYSFNAFLWAKKVCVYERAGYVYYNDNNSSWRPIKLTAKHFFSSLRLILDVIHTNIILQKKGISISCADFLKIFKREHGKRIFNFLLHNPTDAYCILNIFKDIASFYNYIFSDTEFNKNFEGDTNKTFLELLPKSYKDYINYKIHDLYKDINLFSQIKKEKYSRKFIVIYTSCLAKGGLERVAVQLGHALKNIYDIVYVLDKPDYIEYDFFGKIVKADITDLNVIEILHNASYIFDFKYKNENNEFPICQYAIENFPYKYIATIHNTKTCHKYYFKINEYMKKHKENIFAILCVSNAVKRAFIEQYGDYGNIYVVHNPINLNEINPTKVLNLEYTYMLFAGRLNATEHKGIDILIKAYIESGLQENCKLVLAGDGDIDSDLKNLIVENNMDEHIKILGFQKNIYELMKGALFIIAPSRWEGFSMTLIEALGCGTPVLTTRTGGAEEIVIQGKNGFFLEINDIKNTADGMIYMVKNAQNMKHSCMKSVEHLDIKNYEYNIKAILAKGIHRKIIRKHNPS